MKIIRKSWIALLLILGLTLSALVGCSKSSAPTFEPMVSLTMPTEKGITIEKVGDGTLLLVTYNKDENIKEYLSHGASTLADQLTYLEGLGKPFISDMIEQVNKGSYCSAYAALNDEGDYVLGRNLDWAPDDTTILIYNQPSDGYASVALTDGRYFGYADKNTPIEEIEAYIPGAIYFPFDGMNEWGVTVSSNSVYGQAGVDPEKVTIGGFAALRMVLDYAKNTDEAIALIKQYNIFFEPSEGQSHFLISDADGKSAIIEYIDGEMIVGYNRENYQVNTNFAVNKFKDESFALGMCPRYEKAWNTLNKNKGVLSDSTHMALLEKISQNITLWSVLYNKTSGDFQIALQGDYDRIYQFHLPMAK